MTWFLGLLAVVVLGIAAVLAAGRGGGMSHAYRDRPDVAVPADRALTGDDVRRLRFSQSLRGYRMDEVDGLLDLLAAQLDRAADPAGADPAGTSAPEAAGAGTGAAPGSSVAGTEADADVDVEAEADTGAESDAESDLGAGPTTAAGSVPATPPDPGGSRGDPGPT